MDDLGQQLDANGMSDVRFSGPELAWTSTSWLAAMMGDPYLMSKLDHFGLHGYQGLSSDATGVYGFIQQSAYPNTHFWMTEFGVWCPSCQERQRRQRLLGLRSGHRQRPDQPSGQGASAGLVYEAYDSRVLWLQCRHRPRYARHVELTGVCSRWTTSNAATKTYTPRKQFYTLSQISRYVRPGAQRINVSGSTTPLSLLAFYHSAIGELTLTGVNTAASPATLSGTLSSLPAISSLELYYTDSTTNLSDSGAVPVTNSSFVATVPANCVFTLVGSSATAGAPVITQALPTGGGIILRGTNGVPYGNYLVLSTTNAALPQTQWMPLATNTFGPSGNFDCTNAVAPTNGRYYFRLAMTTP